MAEALASGRPFTTKVLRPSVRSAEAFTADRVLRTGAVLRKDEWVYYDREIVAETELRLRGVADLMGAGLTKRIPNGLAKTVYSYQTIGDMSDAELSLSGVSRSEYGRVEFGDASMPMPITHKDWYLDLRHLLASRSEGGEGLDTTHARAASRKVAELAERLLFRGWNTTFAGLPIYGYTTHPNRITLPFGTGGAWHLAAKTPEQIMADVQTMLAALRANRMHGPYWLYIPGDAETKFSDDFKATSDKSLRARLLEIEQLQRIQPVDELASGNVVMVQASPDVVQWLTGEDLQTVQWDVSGGFRVEFKAFQIQLPLIRTDSEGRSGLVHMAA